MGMNSNHCANHAIAMERRAMSIVNTGIREQWRQVQILESVAKCLEGLHPQAPHWVRISIMSKVTGALEIVSNHMLISGWSLIQPWRGSLFLRTWSPTSTQGRHEPKMDWNPPCFDDVQKACISFSAFEQEYCDMHGFYWPGSNPQTKPFSEHPVKKLVKGLT